MKTLITTAILTLTSLFSTEVKQIETQESSVVYKQENTSPHNIETTIIYTKAPTPWVKVFNN